MSKSVQRISSTVLLKVTKTQTLCSTLLWHNVFKQPASQSSGWKQLLRELPSPTCWTKHWLLQSVSITLTVSSIEVYFASLYVEFVTYSYSKTQGEESSLKIFLAGLLCTKPWSTKINDTLYPYPWDEDTFHLYPWEAEEVKGSWNQMPAEASEVI